MESVKSFFGLNNVTDPLRLGLGWLAQADNINISDTGAISKREGYSLAAAGQFTSAFSTHDFARMYVVDAGILKAMQGMTPLKTLANAAPMYWAELNNRVYFNNGVDSGIILPDNSVIDWRLAAPNAPTLKAVTGNLPAGMYRARCTFVHPDGRETGASESGDVLLTDGRALQITDIPQIIGLTTLLYIAPADSTVFQLYGQAPAAVVWHGNPDGLGRDLLTEFMEALPAGSHIQTYKGRMYCATYLPQDDQTVVWYSQPLGTHLFNLHADFFMVQGEVTMLAPHDEALIVGTAQKIYAYDGLNLVRLAEYGVVTGQHWSRDDNRILFWSKRGLCAALPFSNLTERQVSVAPGVSAGGTIVQQHGQKRYVVALQQGGSAFNPYI